MKHRVPLVTLGWRLAWAGGRARAWTTILGAALVMLIIQLAIVVPPALRDPAIEVLPADRVGDMQLTVLLAIPLLALLLAVTRISSSSRDRRLAALRLLGVPPRATRFISTVETGSLVAVGSVIGLVCYSLILGAINALGWGSTWIVQPARTTPATLLTGIGVVAVFTLGAAMAPSRRATSDPRGLRHEASPANPRPWRLVPLILGLGILAWFATNPPHDPPPWWGFFMIAGWLSTGLAVPIAAPYLAKTLTNALAGQRRWIAGHLAGRRLQVEPASAYRAASGLATSLYAVTIVLTLLAASISDPLFLSQKIYLTTGPQPITVHTPDTGGSGARDALPKEVDLAAIPGVQHVEARYPVSATECTSVAGASCGVMIITIGTCQDLSQFAVLENCTDEHVQIVEAGGFHLEAPETVTIEGPAGTTTLEVSPTPIVLDEEATRATFGYGYPIADIFIPHGTPAIDEVIGEPTFYTLTVDGGSDTATAVATAVQAMGAEARVQPTDDYTRIMGLRTGMLAIAAVIVVVGLGVSAIGIIDRAAERRRSLTRLQVIGSPISVLRASERLQAALPLTVSVLTALAAAALAAQAYATWSATPDATAMSITGPILAAALLGTVIIATVASIGLGKEIPEDTLRQE